MDTSQKATLYNGISTIISGLGILLFHHQLAQVFHLKDSTPFLIVGSVITFFALTMFVELKKQRALAILWIITQDALFVIASIIVLIKRPFEISDTGYLLIELFLIPILFFIIYQSLGLSKIDGIQGSGLKRMTFKRTVKADKKAAWEVISDIESYHEVASNIDNVKIVSGEKEGMVRMCSHGKDSWSETCTLWEEEKQYSFLVDTSSPDYPFPFKSLKGDWKVNELDTGYSEIVMVFEFEYTKRILNILLHPILKMKFTKICIEIMDKWQSKLEQ